MLEIFTYIAAILTLSHALRHGGRYPYLWLATIFHGWTVECISYFLPDIDNFWHGQSSIIFLGGRLPLHIVLFYPFFIYTASVSVSKLRLSSWAEPFATGLAVVLLDVPFDIMGIKLMWWTWHDTEPNIYDRHYWVPWTSYYFHASFAFSFCLIFHGTRKVLDNRGKFEASNVCVEFLSTVLTGLFSMPLGTIQFILLYHPLHDVYQLHSEVCVLALLALYVLVIWSGDRNPTEDARSEGKDFFSWFDEISALVIIHYLFYVNLVVFSKPEQQSSMGLHETVGPCNETSPVYTAAGMILSKRKYLCLSDYDEGYYDFHCIPNQRELPPKTSWYRICGTPFPNHVEYIFVVCTFCALGLYVYVQMLANSGQYPPVKTKTKPEKEPHGKEPHVKELHVSGKGKKQKRH
ncbi:uncharacterized protein LOC106154826 isoform X2 [Lingula anatina]|nr:uncharacterized protein LOC106154826 isoform X2 [Lingula anatina]|eukprot:XP_013384780.1 uncharacterized protein LOC106154826 isoform X2 [Lingula anatina]